MWFGLMVFANNSLFVPITDEREGVKPQRKRDRSPATAVFEVAFQRDETCIVF